jgi:hypothetical protein
MEELQVVLGVGPDPEYQNSNVTEQSYLGTPRSTADHVSGIPPSVGGCHSVV